jgi:2-amino-4-hydroxy-6-hydroxymethyldihydropteridine diphosphokinase
MSARAWIGLGANLGDARETIEQAIKVLRETRGIDSLIVAPFYGSDPIDAQGPTFINTVAQINTSLAPLSLLDAMQGIEQTYGRERPYHHAPRTLDLDLLYYEGVNMETPRLTLPHPRMHERAFVLRPLSELAPDLVLKQGKLHTLLAQCNDQKLWPLSL